MGIGLSPATSDEKGSEGGGSVPCLAAAPRAKAEREEGTDLMEVEVEDAEEAKGVALLAVDLDGGSDAISETLVEQELGERVEVELVGVGVEQLAEEPLERDQVDGRVGREKVKVDVDERRG